MVNKTNYIKIFSSPLLVITILFIISNICFAASTCGSDAVKKYIFAEKYSVPYSTVKVSDKSSNQNIIENPNNFIVLLTISILIVLGLNGIMLLGVMKYFKKKTKAQSITKQKVETPPSEPIVATNAIDVESVDEGVRFAQQMGRGYGELSIIQKIQSAQPKKNYYNNIIISVKGKSKQQIINAAKKFGIGNGEIILALKLNEYGNKKLVKERI